jgi:hypothetical protein
VSPSGKTTGLSGDFVDALIEIERTIDALGVALGH